MHNSSIKKKKTPDFKMDRRPERFSKDIDGQQVHEMIHNVAKHQGNASQNHDEISPHTCQHGYYQRGS